MLIFHIGIHYLDSLRIAHVVPRYPWLQVQRLGLVHLPLLQPLLQIAKIYNDICQTINQQWENHSHYNFFFLLLIKLFWFLEKVTGDKLVKNLSPHPKHSSQIEWKYKILWRLLMFFPVDCLKFNFVTFSRLKLINNWNYKKRKINQKKISSRYLDFYLSK